MQQKYIFIIDDDEIVLSLMEHILDDLGVGKVMPFSSSIKALDYVKQQSPEAIGLIVCDWKMPELDGLSILSHLKARYFEVPFLMVTSTPTKQLVSSAREAGANGFIAKPFRADELIEKVQSLI